MSPSSRSIISNHVILIWSEISVLGPWSLGCVTASRDESFKVLHGICELFKLGASFLVVMARRRVAQNLYRCTASASYSTPVPTGMGLVGCMAWKSRRCHAKRKSGTDRGGSGRGSHGRVRSSCNGGKRPRTIQRTFSMLRYSRCRECCRCCG